MDLPQVDREVLSQLPDLPALGLPLGDHHLALGLGAAEVGDPDHLGEDLLLVVAVGLHEEHGTGAGGKRPGAVRAIASRETSSTSSRQRGMTPWARTRETARAASATERKTTSAVATWRGRGRSFRVTSVTIARVPSLPTRSAVRS